jgi:ABC-2 type transport system ATP-binding protein
VLVDVRRAWGDVLVCERRGVGRKRALLVREIQAHACANDYALIEVEDLTKRYSEHLALDGLSFRVEPGEILGFLGPNGAGKTTTVKILTGMLQPDRGHARVAGLDVVEQPTEVKRRIGYVPESGAVYETLTAAEYLDFVSRLHHLDARAARTRAAELLDLFGLSSDAARRLSEFSKGMKQKVLIASALLHNPDVLFLDEPLDGLDVNTAAVVKDLLRRLAAQGRTMLFCSHILEVVERICTRILIIRDGRKVAEGSAADIALSTGTGTLEGAFGSLTGLRDAGAVSAEFLRALDRA